jgi:hypothetical protein
MAFFILGHFDLTLILLCSYSCISIRRVRHEFMSVNSIRAGPQTQAPGPQTRGRDVVDGGLGRPGAKHQQWRTPMPVPHQPLTRS